MSMFCYQCQETVKGQGCEIQGICGKTDEVANLQDMLIYILKGISVWAVKAREMGINYNHIDIFAAEALFSTITNVNFDTDRIINLIEKAFQNREKIKNIFYSAFKEETGTDFNEKVHESAIWCSDGGKEAFIEKGKQVGVLSEKDEDIRSLKELLIYGIKGIAAYIDHAHILKHSSSDILYFIEEALAKTVDENITTDELLGLVMEAGKNSAAALKLLDKANTSAYGHPELTHVYTGTKYGPAILVSGHDLLDLEEILKQTEGKGINVYTHGELLPANAYPGLKRYKHLTGNYGASWYNQQEEFDEFNGAIVMTTNCLQRPRESYKDRIFTTGLAGWQGIAHIPDRSNGNPKDFSPVIEKALASGGLKEKEGKTITIGLAHEQVLGIADKVVEAVKSGSIKRFFVMAGCDGRHKEREYFTELAEKLPKDTVILTAGCAKFRYNMLDMGDIGGIPRVIDAGQCNDSYSLAVIALKLKEVFGFNDINELPISYDIAWYEQKAVCVLLALLFLGVKGIRLGPTLPAFVSKNVLNILAERFDIKPAAAVNDDLRAMLEGR